MNADNIKFRCSSIGELMTGTRKDGALMILNLIKESW